MSARDLAGLPDEALLARVGAMLAAPDPVPAAAIPNPTHLASLAAQPIACTTTRYRCPHCRRFSRSKRAAVVDHMARCWLNPVVRACKTCVHHHQEPAEPDVGLDGVEWCDAQDVQLDGIVAGCPLWALRGGEPR